MAPVAAGPCSGRGGRVVSQHTGRVWSCYQPGCKGVNLEAQDRCGVCFAEKPKRSSFREALEFYKPSPAIDLEDFLRKQLQLAAPQHLLEVTPVGNELFITIK